MCKQATYGVEYGEGFPRYSPLLARILVAAGIESQEDEVANERDVRLQALADRLQHR